MNSDNYINHCILYLFISVLPDHDLSFSDFKLMVQPRGGGEGDLLLGLII